MYHPLTYGLLTNRYPHQLPGYGGYRPQTAVNDVGPMPDEKGMSTMGRMMRSGNNGAQWAVGSRQ